MVSGSVQLSGLRWRHSNIARLASRQDNPRSGKNTLMKGFKSEALLSRFLLRMVPVALKRGTKTCRRRLATSRGGMWLLPAVEWTIRTDKPQT
jgi:hypothetical protein